MADRFAADTSQLEQLGRDFRAAGVQLDELEPVNQEAGRVVVAQARPPRRSGALAASLRAGVTPGGVTFASTARYWTFVHWGAPRRNMRARPWFREAIAYSRDEILAAYSKHAAATLDKIG
jgi:hypothetical protein